MTGVQTCALPIWGSNDAEVDYEKIYNNRFDALRIAYDNFKKKDQKAFSTFKRKNSKWLKNYALYMAVKKSFNMVSWTEWPDEEIRMHEETAVKRYERKLKDDVDFWKFLQFKFYEQWEAFRAYEKGQGEDTRMSNTLRKQDRKSTRLNSSHPLSSRMPSSA